MQQITTMDGHRIPRLGLGTWCMGERRQMRSSEVAALKLGIELGMSLIDTAEMYADGGAEEVVAEAIRGQRERVYLVSKVLPHNASPQGTLEAAERSLRRLDVDAIDLYLLHWPGSHPLKDTLQAFQTLKEQGKIRAYGVSNFDLEDLERADAVPGGDRIAVNQVLYNLSRRGIERRLIPDASERNLCIMAYSPLEQARLKVGPNLRQVAERNGVTWSEIALAWVLRQPGMTAIPKATRLEHVKRNHAAESLVLSAEDLALLDAEYPPPERDVPLETL